MSTAEEWLGVLAEQPASGPGPAPVTPDEARRRMRLLAVPDEDRDAVLATLPDRDSVAWGALTACYRTLFGTEVPVDWPDAPASAGDLGRYFYLHLYLLAVPAALERQIRRGIPEPVVAATFADVGLKTRAYRRAHGIGGFDRQAWVTRHFRGTLHRLGRLQFERLRLDAVASGGAPSPDGPADGEAVVGLHITADGPLTRESCTESFHQARAFHGTPSDGDHDVLRFVFHRPAGTPPSLLPRATTLERAVADHLAAGHHWRLVHGWTVAP